MLVLLLLSCIHRVAAPPPDLMVLLDQRNVLDAAQRTDAEALALYRDVEHAFDTVDYPQARRLLGELEARYPASPVTTRAAVGLRWHLGMIGAIAPPLRVDRWLVSEGARQKGPATLLLFFEVWDPRCREAGPRVAAMMHEWAPRGLKVIGLTRLSRGRRPADLLSFLVDQGWYFPVAQQYEDERSMRTVYGVAFAPTAAVLRLGRVVWIGDPRALDEALVAQLLAGL